MKHLRCQQCRELKPPTEFPVKLSNHSGRAGFCLTCRPPVTEPEPTQPAFTPDAVHRMCKKKHRYGTKPDALAAATRSAKRTTQMRVYQCPVCSGWHLTHKKARADA